MYKVSKTHLIIKRSMLIKLEEAIAVADVTYCGQSDGEAVGIKSVAFQEAPYLHTRQWCLYRVQMGAIAPIDFEKDRIVYWII